MEEFSSDSISNLPTCKPEVPETFRRSLRPTTMKWSCSDCISVKNNLTKSNLGKKGFISAHNTRFQPIIAGKSGQSLKQIVTSQPHSCAERNKRMRTHAQYSASCFSSHTVRGAKSGHSTDRFHAGSCYIRRTFLDSSFPGGSRLNSLTLIDAKTGNVLVELVIKEASKPSLWGQVSQNLVPGAPELGLPRDVLEYRSLAPDLRGKNF